jgi:hypothetical protein
MDSKTLVNALKSAVREVIKEELTEILREGLQSTVTEMKQPVKTEKTTKMPKRTTGVKFSKNNFSDILNETTSMREQSTVPSYAELMNEEMETMKFTSRNAQGFGMQRQAAAPQVMEDPESGKNMKVDPIVAKAMTRDYSALMKAIDKKKGK